MYKIFYSIVSIFWVLDILNMPFMQMFDTTYPINGWAWFLIWMLMPTQTVIKYNNKEE